MRSTGGGPDIPRRHPLPPVGRAAIPLGKVPGGCQGRRSYSIREVEEMRAKRGCVAVLFIAMACLVFAAGCHAPDQEKARQQSGGETVAGRLAGIDGVLKVEKVDMEPSESGYIKEKYCVTFSHPLDWKHPDAGHFPQRVVVGLADNAAVNFLITDGYILRDSSMKMDHIPRIDVINIYKGNSVWVEHRFFGESRPDDLTFDDTKYWEYFTCENSVSDYHDIYTKLAAVLGDRWISTGRSFGGLLTNVYASRYPEDMRAYVSYVAPCSRGPGEERFCDFLYTEIGNSAFGEAEAARLRSMITALQVNLLKNKEVLLPRYREAMEEHGRTYREYAAPDIVYDINVLEFCVQCWQQGIQPDKIEALYSMPEETGEEQLAKASAVFSYMLSVQDPDDWSSNSVIWPYYIAAKTEIGQYHYDFSYLRKALEEAGVENRLSITEDMEKTLLWNVVFTDDQKEGFQYKRDFRGELVDSIEKTKAKIVMIYGGADPWYSIHIPEVDNENIRTFVHPARSHRVQINEFPGDTRNEIMAAIDEALAR